MRITLDDVNKALEKFPHFKFMKGWGCRECGCLGTLLVIAKGGRTWRECYSSGNYFFNYQGYVADLLGLDRLYMEGIIRGWDDNIFTADTWQTQVFQGIKDAQAIKKALKIQL